MDQVSSLLQGKYIYCEGGVDNTVLQKCLCEKITYEKSYINALCPPPQPSRILLSPLHACSCTEKQGFPLLLQAAAFPISKNDVTRMKPSMASRRRTQTFHYLQKSPQSNTIFILRWLKRGIGLMYRTLRKSWVYESSWGGLGDIATCSDVTANPVPISAREELRHRGGTLTTVVEIRTIFVV